MERAVKVAVTLPSLRMGGSERFVVNLLSGIDRTTFQPTLILFQKEGELLSHLPSGIPIIDLKSNSVKKGMGRLIRALYKLKPSLLFSTHTHLNLALATLRPLLPPSLKWVLRESSIPSRQLPLQKYPRLFRFLYRYYRRADLIIAQSQFMKRELLQLVPSLSSKIEVVPNPLLLPSPLPAPHSFPSNLFNLLYVGKLRPEKGVDLLLKALSLLPSRYHLWIVGDGPELPSLQNLTARLSLRERVHFLGPTSNPYPYYRGADLLVLPSRYEGLPNVVLEANGSGLPVVAFNCPGGTGEVVVEGVNGLLVECENWERLAEKIEEGANRPWDREKIAEFTRNRFSPEVTTYRYQQLFLRVLKKN